MPGRGGARPSSSPAPARHAPRLDPDLRRAELADLAALDPDEEWEDLDLAGLDLSGLCGTTDELRMRGCRLRQVRLVGADLDAFELTDCSFEEVDLSALTASEASLARVELVRCRLDGASLAGASLKHVGFTGCRMPGANLRFVSGERVELVDCELTGADLTSAQLPEAQVLGCRLDGVELHQAWLDGARLYGSRLDGLRGVAALRGAHIDDTQVVALAWALAGEIGIAVDGPSPDGSGSSPAPPSSRPSSQPSSRP